MKKILFSFVLVAIPLTIYAIYKIYSSDDKEFKSEPTIVQNNIIEKNDADMHLNQDKSEKILLERYEDEDVESVELQSAETQSRKIEKKKYTAKVSEISEDLQIAIDKAVLSAREKICQRLIKEKKIKAEEKNSQFEVILNNSKIIKQSHKKIGNKYKAYVTVEYIY
jgi:hypothetical protein